MPATAPLRRPSPHPLDREPPASATKVGEMGQSQLSQSHNSLTPLAQLRLPQQQPPDSPGPLQQQQVAQPSQAASSDWTILENPKVQHTLDIELWHTLVHDRCAEYSLPCPLPELKGLFIPSVVCCVKFSPDSRLLAAGCNRNTFLYNTQTGQREWYALLPRLTRPCLADVMLALVHLLILLQAETTTTSDLPASLPMEPESLPAPRIARSGYGMLLVAPSKKCSKVTRTRSTHSSSPPTGISSTRGPAILPSKSGTWRPVNASSH